MSDWALAPDDKFAPPPLVVAELATGKLLAVFEPPPADCVGMLIEDANTFNQRVPAACLFVNVAFSPDGTRLAAMDAAGTITLWEKSDRITPAGGSR